MTIKFAISKCKTKAAYSAKLRQKGKLNLNKIKDQFEVVMETPILVVIKTQVGDVIVHNHGELLFKNCYDLELMEKITKRIYSIGFEK